jgi:hypothetical protein
MRLFDNRYEPHRRKYTLAISMIERGARIRTVTQWTGLSKYCVQNLTRSYGSKTRIPCNRGRSPSKLAYFLKSLDVARESAALAYIALQYQAIPTGVVPDARTSLPGIERGEHVMDAFEVYRDLLPNARISLEHAILLIIELAERSALILARCRSCHDVMVADRLALHQELCPLCRPPPRASLPARRSERPRDLLRQQEFHEGVEEDNADRTRDGHDENEADREMARGHE